MSKKSKPIYNQTSLFNQTSFTQVNMLDELQAIEQGIKPLEPTLFSLSDLAAIESEVEKLAPLPLGSYQGWFVVEKISPLEFPRNIF